MNVDVNLERLRIDSVDLTKRLPVGEFFSLIGTPSRTVAAGSPAPAGHRNPQIHFFDDLGFYANEHHLASTIDAVTFVFWLEESIFPPENVFSGSLKVGGAAMWPGMLEREFSGSSISFDPGVGRGNWSAISEGIYIGLAAAAKKSPSGRRGKVLQFVSVDVCFRQPPIDQLLKP